MCTSGSDSYRIFHTFITIIENRKNTAYSLYNKIFFLLSDAVSFQAEQLRTIGPLMAVGAIKIDK
jgi:hypothetical protein